MSRPPRVHGRLPREPQVETADPRDAELQLDRLGRVHADDDDPAAAAHHLQRGELHAAGVPTARSRRRRPGPPSRARAPSPGSSSRRRSASRRVRRDQARAAPDRGRARRRAAPPPLGAPGATQNPTGPAPMIATASSGAASASEAAYTPVVSDVPDEQRALVLDRVGDRQQVHVRDRDTDGLRLGAGRSPPNGPPPRIRWSSQRPAAPRAAEPARRRRRCGTRSRPGRRVAPSGRRVPDLPRRSRPPRGP